MHLDENQNNKIKVPWFFSWWMIAITAIFSYLTMGITGILLILTLIGLFTYINSIKTKLKLGHVHDLANEKAKLQAEIQSLKSEKALLQADNENSNNNSGS